MKSTNKNDWIIFQSLKPEAALTLHMFEGGVGRVGVAWTPDQAEKMFKMYESDILILCVKVPMCKYCTNMEQVMSFFEDRCWRSE